MLRRRPERDVTSVAAPFLSLSGPTSGEGCPYTYEQYITLYSIYIYIYYIYISAAPSLQAPRAISRRHGGVLRVRRRLGGPWRRIHIDKRNSIG